MPKQYKNSPIVEVVCEFRFELEGVFNDKSVDLFFKKIKDKFPERKKGKINGVKIEANKDGQNIDKIYGEFDEFFSSEEKAVIQLDKGRLSIHKLKPYGSWTEFFPLIILAFNSYVDSVKIKSIQRAGLRYVNNFEIPLDRLKNLNDYLNLRISTGKNFPPELVSFMVGAVFVFNDGKDNIRVQLLDNVVTPTGKTFVLDMDYFSVLPGSIKVKEISEWTTGAHKNIEDIFEAVLTEKAKSLFN